MSLCICPHADERHTIERGGLRYCDSPFCGCFTDTAPIDTDPVGRPSHITGDQQWPDSAPGDALTATPIPWQDLPPEQR